MTEPLSAPLDDFKPRELEILNMMAEGLSNNDIADRLFITTQTVRWYNKQIYSKLGTSRRTEAIALARGMGLIGEEPTSEHRLPTVDGPFIGRDTELAELIDLLPSVRLLSLVAAGGMGKSRLALELGHRVQAEYEWGAVFVDLTPIRRPDDIALTILESLNLTSQQDPEQSLLDYCRKKSLLLIIDNMEYVLAGADLLAELMAAAPDVKIIATSRERLNLRVETVYYLHPITEQADRLFIEVASMMRPNITISEDEHAAVERVVNLVGGLPLALVLAATWVDMLSIPEIADEIEHSLEFLSAELGDMPERQRSIHAVIDPTWKRLTEPEQRAFMWVSVFRGGFTRETFQQVTGGSLRILQSLLSRSLIAIGYGRRYDMHPLLRQYAREKLEAHNMLEQAKSAHLSAYLDQAERQNQAIFSGEYLAALNHLEMEQDNYRAALDWSLAGNNINDGTRLAVALSNFWDIRSHYYESEHYFTMALDQGPDTMLAAQAQCWRSRFRYRLGRLAAAKEDVEQALALAESTHDRATVARCLNYLSHLHPPAEARVFAERALQESLAIEHPQLIITSHNSMGIVYRHAADYRQALVHYEQALASCEMLGDLRGISMMTYNIGLVYENLGDNALAREHHEHSLQLKRQIGDRAGAARRLSVLAYHHLLDEEFETARAYLDESQLLCEEVGDRFRLTHAWLIRAVIEFITMDFQGAQATLEHGLPVVQDIDSGIRLVEYHNLLGLVHLGQGQLQPAEKHFFDCFDAAVVEQRPYVYWLSLMGYALLLWARNNTAESIRISAVVQRLRLLGTEVDLRYAFDPHIYRVEQRIGAEAWATAQDDTAAITLDDLFAEIVSKIRM